MKRTKTIIIKDPKLQRIRNNLRLIILKACSDRKSRFRDQKYNLTHDKNGNYISPSEETGKIIRELNDRWWGIERPLRASIVKCPICGKHYKDMTYHRKSSTWYCIECYESQVG